MPFETGCAHPSLSLEPKPILGPDEVLEVVLKICQKFKQLIEDNGLSKELYNEQTRKPRREETSQKLLYAIADSYCEANNIDLTRESDAGRGPVDFKFSSGYKSRVLIEVKLSKNSPVKGYEKQLAVYQAAERTDAAIFMVIIVSDDTSEVEKLKRLVEQLKAEKQTCPELVVIKSVALKLGVVQDGIFDAEVAGVPVSTAFLEIAVGDV